MAAAAKSLFGSSLALLLWILFADVPARADLFGLNPTVSLEVGLPQTCVDGNGTATCSVNGSVAGLFGTTVSVSGSGNSAASYGSLSSSLSVFSTGGFAGLLVGPWFLTVGSAFDDTLTVGGYTGSGFIEFDISETPAHFFYTYTLIPNINGVRLDFASGPTEKVILPFIAGTSFDLNMSYGLQAFSHGGDAIFIDGSYRLSIDDISLFDGSMNPVSGYTLTAASGHVYRAIDAAVPEPNALILLITGVAGCMGVAAKKTRSTHWT